MFCVAGHDVQRPTHPRLHVRDARDAQIMFEACRLGLLVPVSRRLNDSERAMFIKSGSVFVWQEADDDIGLKRWTDGLMWSCSRMREPFLFYEEKTLGDQIDPNNMKRKDLVGTKHAKELPSTGLLVKQTYSAIVTLPGSPPDAKKRKWHITCYFTHEDFPHLPTLDAYPLAENISFTDELSDNTQYSHQSWLITIKFGYQLSTSDTFRRMTIKKRGIPRYPTATNAYWVFSNLTSVTKLYAFFYTPPTDTPRNGWSMFTPREEFGRMGLGTRTKAWRFTEVNKDYSFCPTYPATLVVPARISDATLSYAAKYRSKARIPSLSYLHWGNFATITRCSQPMVGLTNNRSVQDEKLIEAIFQSHHSAHSVYAGPPDGRSRSTSSPVYGATPVNLIIDARPTTNAMANAAKGAGTENMDNYKEARKVYLGIDNIHVMRDSLAKVAESLYEADMLATMSGSNSVPSDALGPEISRLAFLDRQALRRSGWIKHLTSILEGTLIIVRTIHISASHSLLHCSDGWDRTAQLSSLAQICLDPYFRTLRGFYVLVEKEWLSFGHKFLDRCGHLSSEKLFVTAPSEGGSSGDAAQAFFASVQNKFSGQSHLKETSPVFHQFLESLWQICRQFPTRFEYNEDFLLKVHYHLNSCQFGTFLFNCERERRVADGNQLAAEQRTHSAWDWFEAHRSQWLNPDYDPSSNIPTRDTSVLIPDTKDVRFWYRLYGRGDEEMNGGGIANQAAVSGIELRGPVAGSEDDPVLAGSPLAVLTPSATPPPLGSSGTTGVNQRVPYQPRSPTSIKRTPSGLPSATNTPPPAASRQDSLRPFASTNSAFSMQTGGNDTRDVPASSRAWRNAAEGLAVGAGGVKSMWASLSSNATAAFQAAQAAYDTGVRDYSPPNNESSPRTHEDILSKGGELPTVSRMGSLGRNSGSASISRNASIPDVLNNPWADEAPVPAPAAPTRPPIVAPTPIGAADLKTLADTNKQPWVQPAASPSSHGKSAQPSLVNSIGSLPSSLSDLTLLTEPNLSRSQSSASPRPPPTEPVLSSDDRHQPQSSIADIDPLGVGFR
ncbi:Phosphoinositide 3-phosphatase [Rhizoctonia solani AG-1 IB]|uniref:Phosphoinositide 3-phosphatase n=1 Tax=Thanatephorus cucumeris (strain AG1-IB / isolate 7/3/14) TaxID=1108050 RepID=M5BN64_THACB|nr:Phosphoinositide 3-phosphatase [Rhizoctonia solani AG-1 IB]